jgi:phosphoserine phosphatase RsbU/P
MEPSSRPRIPIGVLYAALTAMALWSGLYVVPYSLDILKIVFRPESVAQVPLVATWPRSIVFRKSTPTILEKDRVVSVDGAPYRHRPDIEQRVRAKGPGGSLDVVVERGGASIDASVRLEPRQIQPHPVEFAIRLIVLDIVMPLLCLSLGFWVTLARPRDPIAWLVLFMLLGLSQIGERLEVHPGWTDVLRIPGTVYREFFFNTWMIWFPLFGLHFAERLSWDRKHPWIAWLLLGPLAAIALWRVSYALARALDMRGIAPLAETIAPLVRPQFQFNLAMVAVGGYFFAMGWKGGVASTPDVKRRLNLLLWGGSAAFTPVFILILMSLPQGKSFEDLPVALVVPSVLALPIFPITLAYVILVERAMDVRVAVRQGLRYAATRGAIGVLVFLILGGVAWAAYEFVSNPTANRPQQLMAIGLGMLAVVFVRPAAQKLFAWTDRRFFREAYDVERVLTGLSDEVRMIVETDPLLDTVLERIGSTLHVDRLAVYLREGDGFVPSRARGYAELPPVTVKPIVENLRAIAASGKAIRVRHDDPDSPIRRGALQTPVVAMLDELGAELVLPLLGKRDVLGFVTLGGKKSEEPYSASDAKLLQSVAAQTGLALENSRLTATIAHEIARRERMSREIEIARDVQLKLFPQRLPSIEGVDCAGSCRPAQGVGGDYYDFLALPGGRLGVALGDVAGKGIPAALLMASLQASLRGQRLSGPADLAQMMTNMNRLIFESSPDNRYATFFYGELDPKARRLDYVNAGHNAPMIFRSGGAVERLRATGPVIGLVDGGSYAQASTTLGSGDLLVVYSDGISEAMNPDDEEWGEVRLSASVVEKRDGSADALLAHLFASADAFASGATQHDDMTVVVVRCG